MKIELNCFCFWGKCNLAGDLNRFFSSYPAGLIFSTFQSSFCKVLHVSMVTICDRKGILL